MKVRIGFVSNSSSEAFICNTKKTLEEIEDELTALLDIYYRMANRKCLSFDSVFQKPKKADKSDERNLEYYINAEKKYPSLFFGPTEKDWDNLEDKIIIYSAGSNSIPYELFEIIEDVYKATRLRLG